MPRARAFADCAELWDRALNSPNGVRVQFKSRELRTKFRQRMYDCRKRARQANQQVNPTVDYSIWDELVCVFEDPGFYLRVSRPKLDEITSGIIEMLDIEEE